MEISFGHRYPNAKGVKGLITVGTRLLRLTHLLSQDGPEGLLILNYMMNTDQLMNLEIYPFYVLSTWNGPILKHKLWRSHHLITKKEKLHLVLMQITARWIIPEIVKGIREALTYRDGELSLTNCFPPFVMQDLGINTNGQSLQLSDNDKVPDGWREAVPLLRPELIDGRFKQGKKLEKLKTFHFNTGRPSTKHKDLPKD